MTAQTFSAIPAIKTETANTVHPLRAVLITVFSLKIAIAAFLLAMISLAPPLSAESGHGVQSAQIAAN